MAIIQARETEYAHYRMRSRREARWAVFFDHAFGNGQPGSGQWEYEVEGLRVWWAHRTISYLPDFWLEFSGQWAEVKGFLEPDSFLRLIHIANGLSEECGQGNDLVVFGEIPGFRSVRWPVQLHRHDKRLWAVPWDPEHDCPIPCKAVPEDRITPELLIKGFPHILPEWAEGPMDRARKARFEWGESG